MAVTLTDEQAKIDDAALRSIANCRRRMSR